jgi:hypothetical protein
LNFRLREWIRKIRDSGDINTRQQLYVFLICLLISIFIWFLIVLSKETYTTIDYPIVFENSPENLVLVNNPDSILSVRFSSGGFELFTLKYLTRKHPIRIDLNKLELAKEGSNFTSIFSTSKISRDIIGKLKISQEYVSISPANIYFRFEALTGKMVKVLPKLKLDFARQYQLSDSLSINPDSVMVVGPEKILSQINYIETVEQEVKQIDRSQTIQITLQAPESLNVIKILPKEVEISLSVEKYTESTIKIPIVNTVKKYKIKTYPDFVVVTYLVTLENFNRVDEDMFTASVDFEENKSSNRLKVNLLHQPSFVKITRIEPEEVEYLLLKR